MSTIIFICILCVICFVVGKYSNKYTSKTNRKRNLNQYIEMQNSSTPQYNFDNADLKMVFCVRDDLKMGAGKIAAQVAHAAVGLFDDITSGKDEYHKQALFYWCDFGAKKIVLRVENLESLQQLYFKCKEAKLPCIMISDAGHTQVPAGSVTVLGIGPDASDKINKITGSLKLMR